MKKLLAAFAPVSAPPANAGEARRRFSLGQLDSFQTTTEACGALLLGVSVLVLLHWIVPSVTFVQSSWEIWVMTPEVSLCFALLGAVLLYYNRHPFHQGGWLALMTVAGGVVLWTSVDPLATFLTWMDEKVVAFLPAGFHYEEVLPEVSAFTTGTLLLQAGSLLFHPSLMRRHRRRGDWIGGLNLAIIVLNTLFMMNYLYGDSSLKMGEQAPPGFAAVWCTSLLGVAILARMGPGYFPLRPFMGPGVNAVLLRKIMPVTIFATLICSVLGTSLPSALDKMVSAYLALLFSTLIMAAVVMRSSRIISANLEEAMDESERLYAGLVGSLEDLGVVLLNVQGRIILWNRGAEHVTGYAASEVVEERVVTLFPSDGIDMEKAMREAAVRGTSQRQGWTEKKGGASFWGEAALTAISGRDGVLAGYSLVIRDLTGKKTSDDELQASLHEKEVMLKEIHHRVKNNLQVISSLLRMQSEKAADKNALDLFTDSQHRVRAMAMVHEYLYQSQDLGRIDFASYVAHLVQNLGMAYGTPGSAQRPVVQVQKVTLSLDTAVPCGLLLTELVSNALKYAYPNGGEGPIFVGFRVLLEDYYELVVSDQGVGLPADTDWRECGSLGLRLVNLLTKQLRGEIRLEQGKGTKFIITFKETRPEAAKSGRRTA